MENLDLTWVTSWTRPLYRERTRNAKLWLTLVTYNYLRSRRQAPKIHRTQSGAFSEKTRKRAEIRLRADQL